MQEQSTPSKPRFAKSFAFGALEYSRTDLERAVTEQRLLDITIIGLCRFADDIPADLAERAVAKFRHWGQLIASPEVREVLRRKGSEASAGIASIRKPNEVREVQHRKGGEA